MVMLVQHLVYLRFVQQSPPERSQHQWISIVNYYLQEAELSTYYLDSKNACDSELSNEKEHLDPIYRS